MTVEGLLVNKLEAISELNKNIYPLCVPESVNAPYIAYVQSGGIEEKDLNGYNELIEISYEINILSAKYKELKQLEKKVINIIKQLVYEYTEQGTISDIEVSVPVEQYEEAIKLQRANIEITIKF